MTLSELTDLINDRKAIRALLAQYRRARWEPKTADALSRSIALIVERNLPPEERCVSRGFVADIFGEALPFFATEQGMVACRDWVNAVTCYELRSMSPRYRERIESLLLPLELVLSEPVTAGEVAA